MIIDHYDQGPVVQSIVSLTSSLVVKMLPVLVSTISNSQVFLLKNVSIYATFNDQRFNDILLSPGILHLFQQLAYMPHLMIKVLMIC